MALTELYIYASCMAVAMKQILRQKLDDNADETQGRGEGQHNLPQIPAYFLGGFRAIPEGIVGKAWLCSGTPHFAP